MTALACAVLAALSIWEYPSRQPAHENLNRQLAAASRAKDTAKFESVCRKGVELLPDDPVWHYNLACAYARRLAAEDAYDELETAIDLGFRDARAIESDADFRGISSDRRFRDVVKYARRMKDLPVTTGPFASVPALGGYGRPVTLGGQNLSWNYDVGAFVAQMELSGDDTLPYAGDLYMNRDAGHSPLDNIAQYPGLTVVRFDEEGRLREADLNAANTLFPYPVFGNCSRAYTRGSLWRSIPRSLMSTDCRRIGQQFRLYVSNQVWSYPACEDFQPTGKNGDVFASVTPYWIVTQGRSWSDRPYVKAALAASGALKRPVKREIVKRGLLAPTVQALLRKSLKGVANEDDYLTPKAHPTCFPPGAVDLARLRAAAAALETGTIPPLARIASVALAGEKPNVPPGLPELTYATPCAWAFVLRAPERERTFEIRATGGATYAFAAVHDEKSLARVEAKGAVARVTIDRSGMTPTNRIDVAVFARTAESGWGAPAFVSFAVVDASAPYSDPALTPAPAKAKKEDPAE